MLNTIKHDSTKKIEITMEVEKPNCSTYTELISFLNQTQIHYV